MLRAEMFSVRTLGFLGADAMVIIAFPAFVMRPSPT